MLFKRLELLGFKSFAKAASLEFPSKITAIVGPNGSGKSNVADAVRWVLGEQSMKSLRGKKGEDLIFSGTQSVARVGKAAVSLAFDNKKKVFPVEFDEVVISRTVYRDGVNDYKLNGSQVRLKDVVELLSKVGLGASAHHIIAQGDSDRILYSSPKERKTMIEEALGLKIFELKRIESERKLGRTKENLKDAESLRREIQPHLKFLESQAEKMKNAAELRKSLEELSREYAARVFATLKKEEEEIKKEKEPAAKRTEELEKGIKKSEELMEEGADSEAFLRELKKLDGEREKILKKRSELEREMIKLEAEAKKAPAEKGEGFSKEEFRGILRGLVADLEAANLSSTMEAFRNAIFEVTQKIYGILENLAGNGGKTKKEEPDAAFAGDLKKELKALEESENSLAKARGELEENYQKRAASVQKEGIMYRKYTEELSRAKEALRALESREEKLNTERGELKMDFRGYVNGAESGGEILSLTERTQLRKKIERAKILLEEAGGVDESVLKEYEETKKRDEFLAREVEDLKRAYESIEEMLGELNEKIETDFKEGVAKINELFAKFFHEIFGGGKAALKVLEPKKVKPKKEEEEEEWEGAEEEEETGLDITVDIPRKRIRSLNMLSGGERALTSIALLFAVSTINPPPFLVLDETDAALDEANSQRYAGMLKELSKRTQLIVVTHNRETMRAADVLYGITMGGDGVSKLLSIQLEEAEDVLNKK